MHDDTQIGIGGTLFPQTHCPAVQALKSDVFSERERAFDAIIAAYWKPVYKYVRIKWNKSNEDAKDLTQGFFLKVIEKDFFKNFDSSKARFRTFLRICLNAYVANEEKSAGAQKRGGDAAMVSFDFHDAENELLHLSSNARMLSEEPEIFFHNEWIRSLFMLSVNDLKKECTETGKTLQFTVFEYYDLNEQSEKITYVQLGTELGISAMSVTNYLSAMRKQFRTIVLQRLRALCATEEEFRSEAESLFGAILK